MLPFKKILLVCNPKTKDTSLVKRAIFLSRENGAELTAVDILQTLPRDMLVSTEESRIRELQAIVLDERKKQIDTFIRTFGTQAGKIDTKILIGTPFVEVIRAVLHDRYDLVMLTAEGSGHSEDRLLGVTSLHLLRKCPCAVWVMKPMRQKRYQRVLAAIDPSNEDESDSISKKIMDMATNISRFDKSTLHVVHACDFNQESILRESPLVPNAEVEKLVQELWKEHERRYGELLGKFELKKIRHRMHFLKGDAGEIIADLVRREKINLMIMGTINRTDRKGILIGSTAEMVLQKVNCSIIALKPDGFVSPVDAD